MTRPKILALIVALSGICSYAETPNPAAPGGTPGNPPAQKESFHIYLLMGQSNMAGRGELSGSALKADNPRILSLNADNQWVIAKDPLHSKVGRTEPGVGPGIAFALEMLKADPKVTIGLVPCAVGGTPLKRWVKKGDLYEAAVNRAKAAAEQGTIKGVLWHQGEADTDKQPWADTYEGRLTQMIKDLRQDLGQPDLPVVVGQLGDFLSQSPDKHPGAETVRAAIKHIPTVLPHVGYADSAGLPHKGDKLHFTAEAQNEMGTHYAKAMQEIQKK